MLLRNIFFVSLLLLISTELALAEESSESPGARPPKYLSPHQPITTLDPSVPLDQLRMMTRPLTRGELEIEADAWFELLRNKSRQIAAIRLGVRKTNQAIAAEDLQVAKESLTAAQAVKDTAAAKATKAEEAITSAARENLGIQKPPSQPTPTDESLDTEDRSQVSDDLDREPEQEVPDDDSNSQPELESMDDTNSEADHEVDQADVVETDISSENDRAEEVDPVQIAVEAASELKDTMLADITQLQEDRIELSERLTVVLNALARKGGERDEYRQYMAVVSGIELDTGDAAANWSAMAGWMTSREGGQRVAWNLARFVMVLVLTYILARFLAIAVNWLLERKVKLSRLAEILIARTIKNVVFVVGFAIALTMLEIDITPVLAAIGATGLVIGLALQGTLSNFASGLMILVNRPFDVGNIVTAGGVTGVIHQMNLFSTTFHTFDNQTIHVPNNEIWNNVITNITANPTRRVDLEFGISYDDDFEQAEQIMKDVVNEHPLVLSDPAPMVVTHELSDSSVNIVCRPWAKTSDWWQVKTDVTREVKRRLDQAGISIPYPQQDIHVYTSDGKPGSTLRTSQ